MRIPAFLFIFIFFVFSPALAQDWSKYRGQEYLNISAGISSALDENKDPDVKTKTGFAVSAAYGMWFESGFRTDLELAFRQVEWKVGAIGQLSVTSLLLNFYYDFRDESLFTPFLGFGLGAAVHEADRETLDQEDLTAAFQGILGFTFEVADNMDVGAGYRLFSTVDPELGLRGEEITTYHNIEFTVRFYFD